MAKPSNVVSIYDYMPADQAIVQREQPATVTILPVIRVEPPPCSPRVRRRKLPGVTISAALPKPGGS